MAALNKRAVLAAMLVILRRRRRHRIEKNKANFKKRLWIRPTNADRLNSGAFYLTFKLQWNSGCALLYNTS